MATERLKIILDDDGSFKKYARNTKGATTSTDSLTKSAIKLGAAYISLEGARKAFDLADEAAKAKDVEKAYNNLAASAGIVGADMLASMKEATAGTIAEFELMQQFATASLLGLPLDRFDEMLAIARGASKATGQTMEFMLNSIVVALGRGSKLMLDNLGILIDVGSANERYAASIGKVSTQLTDAERKQAFINDALEIGAGNLERIGDLGESDADTYAALSASMGNLAIAIGEKLNPVLAPAAADLRKLADAATDLLTVQALTIEQVLTNKEAMLAQQELLRETARLNAIVAESLGLSTEKYDAQIAVSTDLIAIYQEQIDATRAVIEITTEADMINEFLATSTEDLSQRTSELDLHARALTTTYKPLANNVRDTAAVMQKQRDAALASLNAISSLSRLMGGDANSDMQKFLNTAVDVLNILTSIKAIKSVTSAGGFFAGIGSLLGFADGGTSPGGPILVGERGPEIINPPAGTQITNNQTTQQIMGPRVIQLVMNSQVISEVLEEDSLEGRNNIATT